MPNNTIFNLRFTVYCALFIALIIIGGYISIPIPVGPVPITLADFFVMVAGLFLGWKYGLVSVTLYILLGALGMPVFSSGTAGLAILFGPTGGYLFGYLLLVTAVGFVSGKLRPSFFSYLVALIIGNILLYLAGVSWLKFLLNMSWASAAAIGFFPFVIGIVIKIAVAAALGCALLPRFRQAMVSASAQQSNTGDE